VALAGGERGGMAIIELRRSIETAGFFSPLAGMKYAEQTIEVRRDPLTGATALTTSELRTKERMFSGATDWDHAEEQARRAREGCFFCPEKVMEATPRYPEELVEGGRLRRGGVLLFPNLFPLAAVHAVGVNPDVHFLRPSGFTAAVLEEWLGVAVEFAVRAERHYSGIEHLEVCCNNMLPAGASVVHPHFQVLAGVTPPTRVQHLWERSAAFRRERGVGYWRTLVDEETECGERFIGEAAGCTWLTPFAPAGNREVVAVAPAVTRVAGLSGEQVAALAAGLARVLAWYERLGLSAFNFALTGGPLSCDGADHAVLLRVVARSASRPDYRADDYFLQKLLGGELMFASPEEMAATLRPEFAAG
jgi:UDPglucose--hexose-1-phosphate uridylyltransferase